MLTVTYSEKRVKCSPSFICMIMTNVPLLDHCSLWNVYEVFCTRVVRIKDSFSPVHNAALLPPPHTLPVSFPQTLPSLLALSVLKRASICPLLSGHSLWPLRSPDLKRSCCVMWSPTHTPARARPLRFSSTLQSYRAPAAMLARLQRMTADGGEGELQLEDASRGPASCCAGSQVCILSWT